MFEYRFPVVRGKQAKREYYIAMVPLGMINRLFPEENEYIAPEYRAQRKINEMRIPYISRYILENRDSYVFSALAASIDGKFSYISNDINADTGILQISMNARFLINDGQHRKAAIIEALLEDPTLNEETIPIVFFEDKGLKSSQQIFTDLNKNAVKTSNSLSELYDSRDFFAVVTRNVVKKVDFLNSYTDKERDILGKYSSNLFTLNTFYIANKLAVFGMEINNKDFEAFLIKLWSLISQNMIPWIDLELKHISKIDLRENYIATQNVVIQALGRVGNWFFKNNETENMESYFKNLKLINWKRSSTSWQKRAIRENGRIITNKKAVILISNLIKSYLQIPLTKDEEKYEKDVNL